MSLMIYANTANIFACAFCNALFAVFACYSPFGLELMAERYISIIVHNTILQKFQTSCK